MDDKLYRARLIHGLSIIGGGIVALVILQILSNWGTFGGGISTFGKAISSLIYGVVFAFLLNPFVRFADKRVMPLLEKTNLKKKRVSRVSRAISVVFAYVVGALLVYGFIWLVVPQLYATVLGLVETMPGYYANAETWILGILEDNEQLSAYVDMFMERAYEYVESFIHDDLLSSAQQIMVTVTSSLYGFVVGTLNMALGLIASAYILMTKDTLLAQAKKIVVACFQSGTADELMEIGRRVHKIFNGFIVGKILDSLIMAVLSYIILQIMNMPFALLLATIIGVTNVIPYFGPFIGAIPCAILVLLVSPIQCFYFVIFILVMQQIDGNIIGPRILGDNVGIGSFWILVSITVASALFGFMGMLLGVPVFATIYMIIGEIIAVKLKNKGKPVDTKAYATIEKTADLDQKPMVETPMQEEIQGGTEEKPTEK